jgi:branched-chain amino acid transport system substrate-binding protein
MKGVLARHRRIKVQSMGVLAVAVSLAVAAATSTTSVAADSRDSANTITIASVLSLTGPSSAFGILGQQGVQTAVTYLNQHGGIDGRHIVYKSYDDQSTATQASALVQQVAADSSVLAMIGPGTNATGVAGALAANSLHLPAITLFGDPEPQDNGPYVFKTAATYQQHAEAILRFCKSALRRGVIGVEYQTNGYGNIVAKWISQESSKYGVKAILQGVDPTSTDVTSSIQKLIAAKANVIVSVHTTNVAAAINNWASIGTQVPLVESIAASNPLSIAGADQALRGVPVLAYYSGDTARPGEQLKFARVYRSIYHKTSYYTNATGWDAVRLIQLALHGQKNPTRDTLRSALERLPVFKGAAGIIKWTPSNHEGFDPEGIQWLQYRGGAHYVFLTSGTHPKFLKGKVVK